MTPEIIAQLKAEQADLRCKLAALDAVIGAYGQPPGRPHEPKPEAKYAMADARPSATREQMPLERFSSYGQSVIRAAMMVVNPFDGPPTPTKDLVELIESRGQEIRGTDKPNALSSLLARSADLINHGRRGWTLARPKEVDVDTVDWGDAEEDQ
jgi:hypothetical protein